MDGKEHQEFIDENRRSWINAIQATATANTPDSAIWREVSRIVTALQPFMGNGMNHAFLPTGGGQDVLRVETSVEPECLEMKVHRDCAWIARPDTLTFTHFPQSPTESFLLLELAQLRPTRLPELPTNRRAGAVEELVELSPGDYQPRSVWDAGFVGYDEDGHEIPLPAEARLIQRLLKGKVLIVAKASIWNHISATYDGRHNTMTAAQIRAFIAERIG